MTRVVLHIDKLVMRGIDRADTVAVTAGIRAQLKSLLCDPGVATMLSNGGDRFRIKAGSVQYDRADRGTSLGLNIGRRIAKGVTS